MRSRIALREWPIAAARRGLLAYMIPIDLAASALAILAVVGLRGETSDWWSLLLLTAVAIGFEEGARRAARLQIRLSAPLRSDMTSVWAIAGAVTLPAGMAVLLLAAVLLHVWFRQQRPAGEALYRKAFVAATALLGCLAAGQAADLSAGAVRNLPWALSGTLPVVAAMLAYTAVNRLLVTIVLVSQGHRGRDLLGTGHDNLVELATLCLGGLVSLAVLHQPWLVLLAIAPMVTVQRGALMKELETAATTDPKTGLLNAVAWEHVGQRELARAERQNYAVAVLIVDIDRFKLVNDQHGHLIGDTVLRGVGRCISSAVRQFDSVGRFGGEEFVALLPDADDTTALVVAERVRASVNRLHVSDLVDSVSPEDDDVLAVSIGVSCSPIDGAELSDLLHAADGALYRAKAAGRNRVVLANRGTGPSVPQTISA